MDKRMLRGWCVVACVAVGMITASCAGKPEAEAPAHVDAAASAPHEGWGYEGERGPERWGALSADYAACADGREQSPIDIASPVTASLGSLQPRYDGRFIEAVNLGHTLQLTVAPESVLQVGERQARLLQMHLHVPSEHRVVGESLPLEAHFVHQDAAGALLVVGILYREGAASDALDPVIEALPAETGDRRSVDLDVNAVGPLVGEAYYRYDGSLTTPPCTEGVAWHIVQAPRTVSSEQLAAIRRVLTTSARPVQPLHGREVRASAAALRRAAEHAVETAEHRAR